MGGVGLPEKNFRNQGNASSKEAQLGPVFSFALDKSLDFIIDTASGDHPFDPYVGTLKTAGILVLVGAPSEIKLSPLRLLLGMITISGSATGGTKDTQEMQDFCGIHKIYPKVEIVPIQSVNEALERLIKNDVKY
ncbi:unnamed protein product [Dovyalis caffra]|uniref:Alcohol dehydrogenase-like C-terminal domain-containing protein n=1 Tax=Dovyalis caffra TaxID=77055 RepID=A0AAV1RRN1_9ROSI|nr:unnamed protein product [Dovyalis caffra]